MKNPFINLDTDREEIWEMAVNRDIEAFINQDWEMIVDDFHEEGFMGIDAGKSEDINQWKLNYPTLETYKTSWLAQAKEFSNIVWAEDITEALRPIPYLAQVNYVS